MRHFTIAVALGLVAVATDVQAGPRHCHQCGCRQNCKKVCRLVCGTKTETTTEYSSECEDFCVPGPSRKCGVKCDCDAKGRKCCHVVWQPTCAQVRTRAKLVKKEVKKEVPDYKWVVEEICRGCGNCLSQTERPDASAEASLVDDSGIRRVSAIEVSSDEAELAIVRDQKPSKPVRHENGPEDEAPRTQTRGPFRTLQALLGKK